MIDTLEISKDLHEAGVEQRHAEAISSAIGRGFDPRSYVTPEMLRAELAALNNSFVKWIAGLALVAVGLAITCVNILIRVLE